MTLVLRAQAFATAAHYAAENVRKYTNDPYIVHPTAVVRTLESHGISDSQTLAAAWLHDVVEDTAITLDQIRYEFGETVANYVEDLTNVGLAAGNRKERYRINLNRLARAHPRVQDIKMADLIDNTISIVTHDPKFAVVYLKEKESTIPELVKTQKSLRVAAEAAVEMGWAKIGGRCN